MHKSQHCRISPEVRVVLKIEYLTKSVRLTSFPPVLLTPTAAIVRSERVVYCYGE